MKLYSLLAVAVILFLGFTDVQGKLKEKECEGKVRVQIILSSYCLYLSFQKQYLTL